MCKNPTADYKLRCARNLQQTINSHVQEIYSRLQTHMCKKPTADFKLTCARNLQQTLNSHVQETYSRL